AAGTARRRQRAPRAGGGGIAQGAEGLRLARGRADGIEADSGDRQEAAKSLGLAGDETERGNGEVFGRLLRVLTACGLASIRHRKSPQTPRSTGGAASKPPIQPASQDGARPSRWQAANQVPRRQGDMSAR